MKCKSCRGAARRMGRKMKGGKSIFKRMGVAKAMKQLGRRKDVKVLGRKLIKKLGQKIDKL